MLLSNKYKFIFIRTQKTASTSLQLFFGRYCNQENDIVTSINDNVMGSEVFQHNKKSFKTNPCGLREHSEWYEILNKIGEEKWNNYFKFCFTRNPYKKAVSYYCSRGFGEDFKVWLKSEKHSKGENSDYFMNKNNKIMVDFVGKVENLKEDVNFIKRKLDLPDKGEIPYKRSGYRNRKIHYSYYYDKNDKKVLEEKFSPYFENFDYKFMDGKDPQDRIILNVFPGISSIMFISALRRLTCLKIKRDKIKTGYVNIVFGKNNKLLKKKYDGFKIITLIPTLFQDYYDFGRFKTQNNISNSVLKNLLNVAKGENFLNVKSYYLRRNLKTTLKLIAEFLNIRIKSLNQLSNFTSNRIKHNEKFRKYFVKKRLVGFKKYPIKIGRRIIQEIKPKYKIYM